MSTSDRSPRNTASDDPIIKLLIGTSPGGIEAQERQGQREVLASTTLPADLNGASREGFETLGFRFGDAIPGDPLFQEASLPAGWRREGSKHAMWSYIVDERGLRRVAVFYKAAFYDRKAHMNLVNVGYDIASSFIYGDQATFALRPDLTDSERAGAHAAAADYLESAERHPTIYGDRTSRARQVLEAAK